MDIIMIGPDMQVKGGISSVITGYMQSSLVERHNIRLVSSYMDYDSKWKKLFKGFGSYFTFLSMIRKRRPDLVHIHTSFGASFYRKSVFFAICRLFRIKAINHVHGAEFDKFFTEAGAIKKKAVSAVYGMAAATIVLSESWKRNIEDVSPKIRNIVVLKNSVKVPDIVKPYLERDKIVLYMGEIGMRKGAYDLPAIIARVCFSHPDTSFIVCGNGETDRIRGMLEKAGCLDRVTFPGWVRGAEKEALLGRSMVFLLPSYNEGLPMSILEAMSFGLPVVSTTVGGIPELVKNGINGYLSQPGDTEGIGTSIVTLLSDQTGTVRISEENRNRILRDYSLENIVEELCTIYNRVGNHE